MLKRTFLLFTVICMGAVLFTTNIIATERSNDQVITSEELQKMAGLRNKMIESNYIKGQNALTKIPTMLDATPMVPGLKEFKQSLSMKNKLIMVAIMFVLINLIFYFGFDSSDESGENKELDFGEKLNDEIQNDSLDDLLQRTNESLDLS